MYMYVYHYPFSTSAGEVSGSSTPHPGRLNPCKQHR